MPAFTVEPSYIACAFYDRHQASVSVCVQDFIEAEGNIELQKKRQDETNERKNAVEAYVYMLRSQLSDALASYVSESEQASISSKLTDTEVS